MIPLAFFVPGVPRAKQSFRVAGRGRGFTPARVRGWQADVGWAAQLQMRSLGLYEPTGERVTVELAFFLPDARRIDLDNCSKAVLDGLNGIAWDDDQQVVRLLINKYICRQRQGVWIRISSNDRPLEIPADALAGCLTAEVNHEKKEQLYPSN